MKCPDCGAPTRLNDTVDQKDTLGRPMGTNYRKCANKECEHTFVAYEILPLKAENLLLFLVPKS
jgi:hypothetical protein